MQFTKNWARFVAPRVLITAALSATCLTYAHAQSYIWTGLGTTANWNDAANWNTGTVPLSSATTLLTFTGDQGLATTNNIGTFTLNQLTFDQNAGAFSVAGGTLSFSADGSGNGPILAQETASSVSISSAVSLLNTLLVTTHSTFASGGLTLSGVISGNGGLVIDREGGSVGHTGNVLTLSGNNTYSGGTTLAQGNLAVGSSTALGTGLVAVTGTDTSLRFSAYNLNVANDFRLDNDLNITGNFGGKSIDSNLGPAEMLSGHISGIGGITFTPSVPGNDGTVTSDVISELVFENSSSFSGPLTIKPLSNLIGLSPAEILLTSTSTTNGSLLNVTTINLYGYSSLGVNDQGANVQRLNPAAQINAAGLNSLFLTGNANLNSAESITAVNSSGTFSLSASPGTNAGAQLTVGTWNRQLNSTGYFSARSLGSAPAANVGSIVISNDPGGEIGGGGLPGTTTQSILPYAVGFNNLSTVAQRYYGLVRWDSSTGRISILNPATEYATNLATLGTSQPTANARITASVSGLNGLTSVNALVIDQSIATMPYPVVTVSGSGTLHIGSGALLSVFNGATNYPSTGNTASVNFNSVNVNTLDFGSTPGYIFTYTPLVINSVITGTGGIVKAGSGQPVVLTAANTFTGGITLNSGTIRFMSDANLGATSNNITLAGGEFATLSFAPIDQYLPYTPTSLATNRPIFLAPGGGAVSATNAASSQLVLNGQITGSGTLFTSATGVLDITNPSSTYTGDTIVTNGMLAANSDGALGAGGKLVLTSSTLPLSSPLGTTFRNDASFTLTHSVLLLGGGTFYSPAGDNLTLAAPITSEAATNALIKAGSGTLTVTALSTYDGPTTVGDATGVVRPGDVAASANGTLALSGANGAAATSSSFTVNPGAALTLDNTNAANAHRIGNSVGVTLANGTLNLIGNAGASVTQSIGALTVGAGSTVTLAQPVSSGGQSLLLNALTYNATTSANGGAGVFIRGTNLGGSTGDYTQVRFATAPTLVNGIIPGAVGAASATSDPTGFLTYGPNGVQLLSTYGLPSGGSTTNADVSGSVYQGSVDINSLRIGPGGGVNGSVSLNSGELLAAGGANAGIAGSVSLGGSSSIAVTSSDLSVGSIFTSNGFTKMGAGTLTAGSIFNTGNIQISQGTIRLINLSSLFGGMASINQNATLDFSFLPSNASSAVTITGTGTVNLGTSTLTSDGTSAGVLFSGSIAGSGNLNLISNYTLNGGSPNFSGIATISGRTIIASSMALGNGSVVLGTAANGAGTLLLAPLVNTFSPNVTIATSSSLYGVSDTYGTVSGNLKLNQNLLIVVDLDPSSLGQITPYTGDQNIGAYTFTGQISGTGSLSLGGGTNSYSAGNINLCGNNSYSGGTSIYAGNIGLCSNTAFGTGDVTMNAATLRSDSASRTIANNVILAGSLSLAGTNPLTLTGGFNLGNSNQTVNVLTVGNTLTLGGAVANGSLTVAGSGNVLLTNAANTYTGSTTITSGTLALGSTASILTSSGVTINSGGTLAGTGRVPAVTLNSGGILAPGPTTGGVGALTATSLLWNSGGTMAIALGPSSSASDQLDLSGFFNRGGSGTWAFNFSDAGGLTVGQTYTLVQGWSSTTFAATNFSVAPGGPVLAGMFAFNNNSLLFTVNSISGAAMPEPDSLLFLVVTSASFGLFGMGHRLWSRRRSSRKL